jgi:hypothetical protein
MVIVGVTLAAWPASAAEKKLGKAIVRAIRGNNAQWFTQKEPDKKQKLQVGSTIRQGIYIETGKKTTVDLFLGANGPVVRITPNTTMGFDRLTYTKTDIETIIDTGLNLKSGRIQGNVKKLAEASKYEVETPFGVAGIRGTEYDISANGLMRIITGLAEFNIDDVITNISAGESFDASNPTVAPAPIPPTEIQVIQQIFTELTEIATEVVEDIVNQIITDFTPEGTDPEEIDATEEVPPYVPPPGPGPDVEPPTLIPDEETPIEETSPTGGQG